MIIKRCRILVFMLILLVITPPLARAAEGDAVLYEVGLGEGAFVNVLSVAIGDTAYLCRSGELLTYRLGDAEPEKIMELFSEYSFIHEHADESAPLSEDEIEYYNAQALEDAFHIRLSCPFEYKGNLHMIQTRTGKIESFEDGGFVETDMKINLPDVIGADDQYTLSDSFLSVFEFEDRLYVLVRPDIRDMNQPLELWAVDPATGKHEILETEFPLLGICAYKPGRLLGWTPPTLSIKEEEQYPRLFVIDAATGKTVEGPVMATEAYLREPCTPFYDGNTGAIYYVVQNCLLRKTNLDAKPEVVSYFDRELYGTTYPISILSGTHLVIPTNQGVFIRSVQADSVAGGALKIASAYMPASASAFMRENPDIPLESVSSRLYTSTSEIVQKISSGEDTIDIFVVLYNSDVRELLEKGYALDLSGSEAITSAVGRMYDPIREAIMADEKALGFPATVDSSLWTYNKAKLDELGIEYPETYVEFIELYERWKSELRDENPGVFFTADDVYSNSYFKDDLIDAVFDQHIMEYEGIGEHPRFNTPEFLETMRRVVAIPEDSKNHEELSSLPSDDGSTVLFQRHFGFHDGFLYQGNFSGPAMHIIPAPAMRISRDSEPTVGMELSLYIVNPNSHNADKAIKFLEYLVDHSDYSTMLTMYPDYNEPEAWLGAPETLEEAEQSLAEVMAMEVTDENRRDVEEMIAAAELDVKQAKANYWRVSPEMIASYRSLMDASHLVINPRFFLFDSNPEIRNVIVRYMAGQLSLDQMSRELDEKMRMVYLERQ